MEKERKNDFLKNKQVFYDQFTIDSFENYRKKEFPCLDGLLHLDHAAATCAAKSQLENSMKEMVTSVYGNPHSKGPISLRTRAKMDYIRNVILNWFHTSSEEYTLLFTSGATASLKMIGESFPWNNESCFYYAFDSHTSVLGIRSYVNEMGNTDQCHCVYHHHSPTSSNPSYENKDTTKEYDNDTKEDTTKEDNDFDNFSKMNQLKGPHLFAFPAECNFSGKKTDLNLIDRMKRKYPNCYVLLDAAKYVSTSPLDLSQVKPDFVTLSFYKMFGYPTGCGALLVHNRAISILQKKYYGGGTVNGILCSRNLVIPRENPQDKFADGTESYLAILALNHGFQMLEQLGMTNVRSHTFHLSSILVSQLKQMHHPNGQSVCVVYGWETRATEYTNSGIVALNFLRCDGSFVGYAEVDKLASLHSIQLRVGCFCNPGACQKYLQLTDDVILQNISSGHVCWDDVDVINGLPTGAVRVSFGYMSTYKDLQDFLHFVQQYFIEKHPSTNDNHPSTNDNKFTKTKGENENDLIILKSLYVYPIKSCKPMKVSEWEIGTSGLVYDREWTVVSVSGQSIRQKDNSKLSQIQPTLDLIKRTLTLSAVDLHPESIVLSLDEEEEIYQRNLFICGQPCQGILCGNSNVSEWLTECLGVPCSLVRAAKDSELRRKAHSKSHWKSKPLSSVKTSNNSIEEEKNRNPFENVPLRTIGFANEGQFLLISTSSVDQLNRMLLENKGQTIDVDVFRANFVIQGCFPHEEDNWKTIEMDGISLQVVGSCARCSMVNIDQGSGKSNPQTLRSIAAYRRVGANIPFGQFLAIDHPMMTTNKKTTLIHVGAQLHVIKYKQSTTASLK